jgi:hypothetical protein
VLGGLVGGTVAYGIASSGPVPPAWSWELARFVGGVAFVCAALGALFPRTFWRPRYAPRWWQP